MSTSIGAGIELGGASSFNQAMKLAASAAKNLKAELANVASQFDKTDRSAENLTAQNEVLGKSLDLAKQKVSATTEEYNKQNAKLSDYKKYIENAEDALSKVTKEYGEHSKEALLVQSSLAKIQTAYDKQAVTVQNFGQKLNVAEKEVNDLTREIKENESAMKNAGNSSDKAADEIEKVGKAAESGKGGISVMTVALGNMISNVILSGLRKLANAIKDAISTGIEFNMQIETYQASFTSLLGSQEKAVDMVQELRDAFKGTVFNISETASAAQTLLGYGVAAEDIIPVLQNLGDISLGNKDNFNSLALAFGQVQAKGKLAGEEVRQMVNAGFNPLQEISKMLGISMEEVSKMMSDGAISAEMVAEAFAHATGESGLFFGAMENQSKTLSGQLATLKASVQEGLGKAFEGVSKILAEKVIPKLLEFVESVNWEAVGKGIADVIEFLIDLYSKIEPFLPLVTGIVAGLIAYNATVKLVEFATKAWNTIQQILNGTLALNPIGIIVALIAVLVTAIIHLWNTNEDFRNWVKQAWEDIKTFFSEIGTAIATFFTETIPDAFNAVIDWFAALPGEIWEWLKKVVSDIVQWGSDLANKALDAAKNVFNNIVDTIKSLPSKMLEIGRNLIEGIWNGISNAASWLWNKIQEWCGSIVDGIKDFFGINSPAKLLQDEIGEFMPPGISIGFVKAMPKAIKDMKSAMGGAVDTLAKAAPEIQASVTSGFDSLPDAHGSSSQSAGYTYSPVFQITIHADGNADESSWRDLAEQFVDEISEKLEMRTQKQLRAIGGA